MSSDHLQFPAASRRVFVGQSQLKCRPATAQAASNAQIIVAQVCCMNDHIAIVYSNKILELYHIHKQAVSSRVTDVVKVARIVHNDSFFFLTSSGNIHYMPMSSDPDCAQDDIYLASISDLEEDLKPGDMVDMLFDYSKSLLVVYALGLVLIFNTNIKYLESDSSLIPAILTSDKYSIVDRALPSIISRSINCLRFWGRGNTCGIALSGNSETIEFWPIHAVSSENGIVIWKRRREKVGVDMIGFGEKSFEPAPSHRVERVLTTDPIHNAWISVLSQKAPHHHESKYSIYASGDESGTLVFWLLEEIVTENEAEAVANTDALQAESESLLHHHVHRPNMIMITNIAILTRNSFDNRLASITSIISFGDEGFWVGYSTGDVVLVTVDPSTNIVAVKKTISTQCTGGIEDLLWNRLHQQESYKLWIVSKNEGLLYEFLLPSEISSIQLLWPTSTECLTDYLFDELSSGKAFESHKSYVEVCSFVSRLNLLACAGCHGLITIWDIANGSVFNNIKCSENSICALNMFEGHLGTEYGIFVLCGCRNGRCIEYFLPWTKTSSEGQPKLHLAPYTMGSQPTQDLFTGSILDSIVDKQSLPSIESKQSTISKLKGGKSMQPCLVVENLNYSPLPVSDILVSDQQQHVGYCFARIFLVVHSRFNHKAILQMQFESVLRSITSVGVESPTSVNSLQQTPKDALDHSDRFILALQGPSTLKLFDVLKVHIEAELQVQVGIRDHRSWTVARSMVWVSPETERASSKGALPPIGVKSGNTVLQQLSGLAALSNGEGSSLLCTINSTGACNQFQHQLAYSSSRITSFHKLVSGWSIDPNNLINAVWSYRDALILGLPSSNSSGVNFNSDEIRAVSCHVEDGEVRSLRCKSRIVFCHGLTSDASSRCNKFMVVLSDGYCAFIDV